MLIKGTFLDILPNTWILIPTILSKAQIFGSSTEEWLFQVTGDSGVIHSTGQNLISDSCITTPSRLLIHNLRTRNTVIFFEDLTH